MKIRTIALTAVALSSAAGFALASSAASRPLKLAEVVAQLESRYPGEVTAIEYDASGDKRAHYHVDMRFPASGVASVDVDAVTLAIATRDVAPLAAGTATLPEVVTMVAGHLPGQITRAQFDSASGAAPHYDVDVRLPSGVIARMKIDTQLRQIAWRSPAIIED